MQNKSAIVNRMSADQREQLEADYTFKRVIELKLDPVRGNFDSAHLRSSSTG
jgi:cell filamentation protein